MRAGKLRSFTNQKISIATINAGKRTLYRIDLMASSRKIAEPASARVYSLGLHERVTPWRLRIVCVNGPDAWSNIEIHQNSLSCSESPPSLKAVVAVSVPEDVDGIIFL